MNAEEWRGALRAAATETRLRAARTRTAGRIRTLRSERVRLRAAFHWMDRERADAALARAAAIGELRGEAQRRARAERERDRALADLAEARARLETISAHQHGQRRGCPDCEAIRVALLGRGAGQPGEEG